ncbi:hypothetical protein TL16_g00236 [Triparma laevis f. inornata]|uniref:HAD-like protein n=1 Tax=Triparma laevis f. inornata TaxID=1714386 RepID=A0A9W6ZBE0_9STRA|nr:hypothetical protein TL16_g00236 [Triparma laevis f. inornata]
MEEEKEETKESKPEIKAILFDIDGTLLDTESLRSQAILKALSPPSSVLTQISSHRSPPDLPWDLKRLLIGLPSYGSPTASWSPIVLRYFKEVIGWSPVKEGKLITPSKLWGDWEMEFNELLEECRVCKGANTLIQELSKLNLPLGIATSSGGEGWSIKIQRHSTLFSNFTCILTGDDPSLLRHKPFPDPYILLCDRMNVKPEEGLVFEDSKAGCVSAVEAGCRVVAVVDRRQERGEFWGTGCEEVLGSLEEFKGERWGLEVDVGKIIGAKKRRSRRG